jgi:hypothetical protein
MSTVRTHQRLTAAPEAAGAYEEGVDALLRLRSGALLHFARALALDPTFALAHAALALLGQEFGAPVDVESRRRSARLLAGRCNEVERSHLAAVDAHLRGDRRALVRHLQRHPEDRLALTVAVPTIAFSGVTESPPDAWELVESCAPAYGDHWFYTALLAFVRQEQRRWDEAMQLACSSLEQAPDSGHAAHARAHVHYETGDHAAGLTWLDDWIHGDGADTDNLSHYSWHAALHELSNGDLAAVARRFECQLTRPHVHGTRAIVDTGSLLWRWTITPGVEDVPDASSSVSAPRKDLLAPASPFLALHAAVTLCAAADATGLAHLAAYAEHHEHPVHRAVTAPLARALRELVLDHPSACADQLAGICPEVWRVGGSEAQREVVEETLLVALLRADRYEEARELLDARLSRRRCCRRDEWFRTATEP